MGLFPPNHSFSILEAMRDMCFLSNAGSANILVVNKSYGKFSLMSNEEWACQLFFAVWLQSTLSKDLWLTFMNCTDFCTCILSSYRLQFGDRTSSYIDGHTMKYFSIFAWIFKFLKFILKSVWICQVFC